MKINCISSDENLDDGFSRIVLFILLEFSLCRNRYLSCYKKKVNWKDVIMIILESTVKGIISSCEFMPKLCLRPSITGLTPPERALL